MILGVLGAVVAALFWAIGDFFAVKPTRKIGPMSAVLIGFPFALMISSFYAFVIEGFVMPAFDVLIIIFFAGLFNFLGLLFF